MPSEPNGSEGRQTNSGEPVSPQYIVGIGASAGGVEALEKLFGAMSTVMRRIERRLLMTHSDDFESYVDQVEQHPEELDSLYHDLLIGVTQFFRDREAFAVLESQIIPELLQREFYNGKQASSRV